MPRRSREVIDLETEQKTSYRLVWMRPHTEETTRLNRYLEDLEVNRGILPPTKFTWLKSDPASFESSTQLVRAVSDQLELEQCDLSLSALYFRFPEENDGVDILTCLLVEDHSKEAEWPDILAQIKSTTQPGIELRYRLRPARDESDELLIQPPIVLAKVPYGQISDASPEAILPRRGSRQSIPETPAEMHDTSPKSLSLAETHTSRLKYPTVEAAAKLLAMVRCEPVAYSSETPVFKCSALHGCPATFRPSQVLGAASLIQRVIGYVPQFSPSQVALSSSFPSVKTFGVFLESLNPRTRMATPLLAIALLQKTGFFQRPALLVVPSAEIAYEWEVFIKKTFKGVLHLFTTVGTPPNPRTKEGRRRLQYWLSDEMLDDVSDHSIWPAEFRWILEANARASSAVVITTEYHLSVKLRARTVSGQIASAHLQQQAGLRKRFMALGFSVCINEGVSRAVLPDTPTFIHPLLLQAQFFLMSPKSFDDPKDFAAPLQWIWEKCGDQLATLRQHADYHVFRRYRCSAWSRLDGLKASDPLQLVPLDPDQARSLISMETEHQQHYWRYLENLVVVKPLDPQTLEAAQSTLEAMTSEPVPRKRSGKELQHDNPKKSKK